MNRTIKEATVKRYHYGSHEQLKTHNIRLHDGLQFCQKAQNLEGTHALRICLQNMESEACPRVQKNQNDLTLDLLQKSCAGRHHNNG